MFLVSPHKTPFVETEIYRRMKIKLQGDFALCYRRFFKQFMRETHHEENVPTTFLWSFIIFIER